MQKQFPGLKHLGLSYWGIYCRPAAALPDGFLGGSAPHLQSLTLDFIPFPALPKFLLTTTDLVHLALLRLLPTTWYISPDVMVTCMAMLVNLKSLRIEFMCVTRQRSSYPPPPPARTVLPALTRLVFDGASEYLEDLVARIDAPLLSSFYISFPQVIIDIPCLTQFMRRTTRIQVLNEAFVEIDTFGIRVRSLPPTRSFDETSGLKISWGELDRQPSHVVWIFTSVFPSIMVESLYIYENPKCPPRWQDNTRNMQWLGMFYPFSAVKNLYASKEFAPRIVPALQELTGRTTEVLPNLQNIFLEGVQPLGPIEEGIREFVAARQPFGHPITVSPWERESERD
jgi:hypothetical protein